MLLLLEEEEELLLPLGLALLVPNGSTEEISVEEVVFSNMEVKSSSVCCCCCCCDAPWSLLLLLLVVVSLLDFGFFLRLTNSLVRPICRIVVMESEEPRSFCIDLEMYR